MSQIVEKVHEGGGGKVGSQVLYVTLNSKFIVKTPTTTSIQLKATSTAVGFDTIMTLHHHHHPPTHPRQELYSTFGEETRQCKLTQS